jgi:hypothetical protein
MAEEAEEQESEQLRGEDRDDNQGELDENVYDPVPTDDADYGDASFWDRRYMTYVCREWGPAFPEQPFESPGLGSRKCLSGITATTEFAG